MKYFGILFLFFSFIFAWLVDGVGASSTRDICIRENGTVYVMRESRHGRIECKKNDTMFSFDMMSFTGGMMGPQGPAGATGAVGPQGATGAIGPQGSTGEKGEKGDIGPMGPQGSVGERGEKGEKGDKGDVGETGPKGDTGVPGEIGPKGEPGEKGEIGPQGIAGVDGKSGVSRYEIIMGEISPDDELQKTVTAICPSGKVVIGGGFMTQNVSNSNEVVITRNYPQSSTTWEVKGGVDGTTAADESFSLQAYAICGTLGD